MPIENHYFYCKSCKRIVDPTWYVGFRKYAAQALRAPYFMCGRCRTVGIRVSYVCDAITAWRSSLYSRRYVPPTRVLYRQVMTDLDTIVAHYCATAGYRKVRAVIPQRPPQAP